MALYVGAPGRSEASSAVPLEDEAGVRGQPGAVPGATVGITKWMPRFVRFLRAAPPALFTSLLDYATTSLLPLHNLPGPTVAVAPAMRSRTVHQ